MAVFGGTIRSKVLGMDTALQVILPYDRPAEHQQSPCKVLYLLHGLGECATSWCRHSSIERLARERGLAVIMPEVQRSFYTDMHYGLRYFTYVTEELPQLCRQLFHISAKRGDTFVAGLSMGGYGALRCALARPESYAAAASFSGAVDIEGIRASYLNDDTANEFIAAMGSAEEIKDENNLYKLAVQAYSTPFPPRLLLTCGEQDYLLAMNQDFYRHLQGLPLHTEFHSWAGAHEWPFWEQSLPVALDFFLGEK